MFINKLVLLTSKLANALKGSIQKLLPKDEDTQVVIDYKVEEIFWLIREYLALDSQFTKWISTVLYDFLDVQERRFFRNLYKKKLKLKKQIEEKQKEIERKAHVSNMEG